ncbi:MAG: PTS system mannose/fructose/sorbose family transporter subunit IID [Parafannyhessea sp.]|uniref:PTS system mannose/fructose/sorbose family transporter subunit IID n=1 Tax=Parafannyhessea sp. TaxID=2847324 RepID=UPI000FF862EE|nr:MAG: PTS system mannose/fructose/sorbose family transporter subunit IID [Coriobacteriaceae bacterium]
MASNPTNKKGEPLKTLSKKDITQLGINSLTEQIAFSFERMQAPGWTMNMIPGFKKIYGDSKEDLSEFMTYNMEFMNTEPHMATLLQGMVLAMEEKGTDRKLISSVRNGLFGPMAGIGDSLFWYTVLPITAGIACSLAKSGSVLGPLVFIAIYLVVGFSRIWFAHLGYNLGSKAVEKVGTATKYLTGAAGILGTTVIGALIPSYVTVEFQKKLVFGVGSTTVQSVFNQLLPNVLPLATVFLIYWLFKKKHVNTIAVIGGVIVFGLLMSLLNWM